MTMAKKLPIFYPSIHTFELHGKYHSYAIMTDLFERMKELIAEGKYHRTKNKKKKDKKKKYEHREKAHNKLMRGSGGQNGRTDWSSVRMESRPSVAGTSGDIKHRIG